MNYKRKAHRSRFPRNTMDNQSCRFAGNAVSAQVGNTCKRPDKCHVSKTIRNRVNKSDLD